MLARFNSRAMVKPATPAPITQTVDLTTVPSGQSRASMNIKGRR